MLEGEEERAGDNLSSWLAAQEEATAGSSLQKAPAKNSPLIEIGERYLCSSKCK